MKKNIVAAVALMMSSACLMAQTEFDALKYVQSDINGSARYMSMAGAFGALGGDASAIKDNPAGLGIFRRNEIAGSVNVLSLKTNSTWNMGKGYSDMYKNNFNNFSFILTSPTWKSETDGEGLLSSNYSFTYNRLKSFNRSLNIKSSGFSSASSMTNFLAGFTGNIPSADLKYIENEYEPFDNTSIPWLSILAWEGALMNENVDQSNKSYWTSLLDDGEKVMPGYRLFERGYVDEYSFGWAGNFSNRFFLGATLNYQTMRYFSASTYSESFEKGGSMALNDTIDTRGDGFNLKLGGIFCPTDFLRLGLSVQSPTIYSLNDIYNTKITYDTSIRGSLRTPEGSSEYQLQSPWIVNMSGAYIFENKGLLSVEYDYVNYASTRLRDKSYGADSFDQENEGMRNYMRPTGTLKIGGEYKVSPNFALRAGYATTSSMTQPDAAKEMRPNTLRTDAEYFLHDRTEYLSCGFGYRESNWFVDFAYMNKNQKDLFYPYNSSALAPSLAVTPAKVNTITDNFVVTLGFKF